MTLLRLLPVVAALALAAPAASAAPALGEPMDVVAHAGGTYLVTDRAGAVLLVDPARRTARRVARVPEARELAVVGGRVLVTSGARILALDVGSGRTRPWGQARTYVLGLAAAPGGGVYASEDGSTIVRIDAGGRRTVLARGLDGVHGVMPTAGGLVLSESSTGRVLRLDLRTKRTRVLAAGLSLPSFTAADGGTIYVSEFGSGEISRLAPSGRVTTVAEVGSPGPILVDARRRIVGVSLFGGSVFRIENGRARTLYP